MIAVFSGPRETARKEAAVALASVHPLGGIKPAWAATFRGLHALAVDDAGRGGAVAPGRPANAPHQNEIDPTPDARVAPAVEVVLDGRARRKILRQRAPLAAGRKNIEDRIQNVAQSNLARAPDPSRRRHQRCKHHPFLIRHVACIAQAITPILLAGDFSPNHVVPPRRLAITKEAQQTEITQYSFSARLSG